MKSLTIIVTDTSPLITLALADALPLLLRPRLRVCIPDAVYVEATRVRGAPGASRLIEWINGNSPNVVIVPTEVGVDQLRRMEEGRSLRGLGEQAAIEALETLLRNDPEAGALLLFEDGDVERRRAVLGERAIPLSTGDFLRELEAAGMLQSADEVLDAATAQGRNLERQRRLKDTAATPILGRHLSGS